ncbi:MAG: hypothetical protein ACOYK6_03050 [Chthoniobacterales bacterium]
MNLFFPTALYSESSTNSVLLLEPGEIPTTFFYALPRISEQLKQKTHRYNSIASPPDSLALAQGTWVIIVRHASRSWLQALQHHVGSINKVTYLQDDDIPAVFKAHELPFFYRLRTWWRYYTTRSLLAKVVSEIALSTEELAARYSDVPSTLWEPLYPYKKKRPVNHMEISELTYFYHGTITHRHEIKWLLPIIQKVQEEFPHACFELMGDISMKNIFQKIPRVRILPAMKWPNYYAYLVSVKYAVGLAPLLDTPFNRARSHTKLYQITCAGAAGIFSDIPPYSKKIIHGSTGILSQNDPDLWIETIINLLQNKNQRETICSNASAAIIAAQK